MLHALVFVSGATSGIGLAIARSVPFSPARVIDASRRGAPPDAASPAVHLAADLATPAGWDVLAACFERELAAFDGERAVFFHNAGTLDPIGFAGEVDARAYRANVLLNSAAPQILGDAFLRAARSTRARCDLVMVSSGAARSVYEGWSSYCAGKAAMDQWTRTVGAEQARRGGRGRVIAVAPGVVATEMQAQIRRTAEHDFPDVARFHGLLSEGALRSPDEVARDLWSLVLDDAIENGAVLDLRTR